MRCCGAALALAAVLMTAQGVRAADLPSISAPRSATAAAIASRDTLRLAAWIVANADNDGLPYIIVDKAGAAVFASDPQGRPAGSASALLGLGRGDDSLPGIGDRKLSAILPEERITPAGRFVAALGENLSGKAILWVDYEAAISLHPVVTTNLIERRAERLATRSPSDNRISYGCINVPAEFFSTVVQPLFEAAGGIVYVLPETRSIETMLRKTPAFAAAPAKSGGIAKGTVLASR